MISDMNIKFNLISNHSGDFDAMFEQIKPFLIERKKLAERWTMTSSVELKNELEKAINHCEYRIRCILYM